MTDRSQDQQWQALLDSAGEGVWGLDLDGRCSFVNQMAVQLLGFSSREIVGQNVHSLIHHHHADGTEYLPEECPVYQVLRTSVPLSRKEDTLFRKDGSSFLAEMSAQPVKVDGLVVGLVVTFRDVSDSRRQQQELRRAYDIAEQRTAELDAVIESIPHGVYIATKDGKVRLNRRARQMAGDTFPAQLHTLQRALEGESTSETICRSDTWIHSVAAPIALNDLLIGGVAVNTDITQVRLQEDVMRKSEKLAAVGQLASSIAHEINNPLESITNLLYLMRQSSSMQEVQEYAEIAQSELARVSEITLQTLRFHRQQSKPTWVDVGELLSAVMSLYTGRFLVRGITIAWKIVASMPVFCLEGELRQVLNNLIRNASDAMSEGGKLFIRLRPACGPQLRDGVRITIADTGEGISPAIADYLFEPFRTTKDVSGTGLGLWVSKGIIDKHEGLISVRTRRGDAHGTIFAVWLPLQSEGLLSAEVQ